MITPTMDCCGYVLCTNVDDDLELWADDVGSTRKTTFPEDAQYMLFEGRNHQVGFHPLEDGGAVFTRTLMLAISNAVDGTEPTSTPGDRTFDPLLAFRASRGAGLPYVCLLNQDGDRWFVSMQTAESSRTEPHGLYTVDVEFRTVTDEPYPVDVTP